MIYFQVHRSYVMYDDITDRAQDWKDQVGIARFEHALDARNFILRPKWTDDDLRHPNIQWDCSHEEMLGRGWELDYDKDKEPTEAVDSGLLEEDVVPVVLRTGRGFSGIDKIMAVLPTLPPNPWLYGHNPDLTGIPKMFVILHDGGRFMNLQELRPTAATTMDNAYRPIMPVVKAFMDSIGKKILLCNRIMTEHTLARKKAYENAGDISMGNTPVSSKGHVASFNRVIDLG